MPVKIRCPNPDCGASYMIADDRLGRAGRCKKCGRKFPLVPETRAEGTPSPQAGPAPSPGSVGRSLPPTFGRYTILRQLGGGGMGTVYLARDSQLEREVALKVPHPTLGENPEARERFLREARAAARFHHPNFCPIHDVGEIDGVHYLTMAYIEGRTLASVIARDGPLPPRRAAEIARLIAVPLAEAHRQGVVHRDLKPANIMVDQRGQLVIMDFGLALRLDAGDPRITATGALLGTPAYMSPEQVEGEKAVGPPSDIYGLGVILYELMTGRRPFEGPTTRVLGLIAFAEPPPPSSHRPGLPSRLEAICLKAMAKRPEDRHASMDQLADDLRDWQPYEGKVPGPPEEPVYPVKPPRRPGPEASTTPDTSHARRRPPLPARRFYLSIKAWGVSLIVAFSALAFVPIIHMEYFSKGTMRIVTSGELMREDDPLSPVARSPAIPASAGAQAKILPSVTGLPKLYVLAIGVSDYPEPQKLRFATDDAVALESVFKAETGGLFSAVETRRLVNGQATREGILDGFSWLKLKLTKGDVGIIFFSGTGIFSGAGQTEDDEPYIYPFDVAPKHLSGTALSRSLFRRSLDGIEGKLVILLDACYSGSFTGDQDGESPWAGIDVSILCSSSRNELSQEAEQFGHGNFSQALIEGLKGLADRNNDGLVDISELERYVLFRVPLMGGGAQHPVISRPPAILPLNLTRPGRGPEIIPRPDPR